MMTPKKPTRAELEEENRQLREWIRRVGGKVVPTQTITIRLPADLVEWIDDHAPPAERGRSKGKPNRSEFIKQLICYFKLSPRAKKAAEEENMFAYLPIPKDKEA